MSTNRIIVDAKVYDEFVDRFTTHVKGLKVGNPNEPDTAIGPVINQNQLKGHLAHIQGARAAGARQVLAEIPRARRSPPLVRGCHQRHADRPGRNVWSNRIDSQGPRPSDGARLTSELHGPFSNRRVSSQAVDGSGGKVG
jgi:hypothetical protein